MPASSRQQLHLPLGGLGHWERLKPRILAKEARPRASRAGGRDVTSVAKMNLDRLQVHCKWEMSV
jgi:hypothetical protein